MKDRKTWWWRRSRRRRRRREGGGEQMKVIIKPYRRESQGSAERHVCLRERETEREQDCTVSALSVRV